MAELIKIYTTTVCPYCVKAKAFLKSKGFNFVEIDVNKDRKAAQEMVKLSGQSGVPVIEIGDVIIVGFDEEEIENALKNLRR